MIGKTMFAKDHTGVIGVTVNGDWTEGKYFCRTIEESPRVIIRSEEELKSTKLAAKKLENIR